MSKFKLKVCVLSLSLCLYVCVSLCLNVLLSVRYTSRKLVTTKGRFHQWQLTLTITARPNTLHADRRLCADYHLLCCLLPPPKKLFFPLCLLVCLLSTLCKNYWSDIRENFTRDAFVDEEELIKFWKSSACGCESRIFKDSSPLRDVAFFHNLRHISGKNIDRIFMKMFPQIKPSTCIAPCMVYKPL